MQRIQLLIFPLIFISATGVSKSSFSQNVGVGTSTPHARVFGKIN